MWTLLFSFLGGPLLDNLVKAYQARLTAQGASDTQAVTLAVQEIQGEIAQRQTEATIIRQEQGWWVTAMIRPLMAMPFIIFTWKVIVWDKVLGSFTNSNTDPLDSNMWSVFITVVGAYFGGRTIEKVARIFKR